MNNKISHVDLSSNLKMYTYDNDRNQQEKSYPKSDRNQHLQNFGIKWTAVRRFPYKSDAVFGAVITYILGISPTPAAVYEVYW